MASLKSGKYLYRLPKAETGQRLTLVYVDCFSLKTWIEILPSVSAAETKKALTHLFRLTRYVPDYIGCDRDPLFKSCAKWLTSKGIFINFKASGNKAAVCESRIKTIRQRLGVLLREKLLKITQWPKVLPNIVNSINKSVCRYNFVPNEIVSRLQDPFVRQQREKVDPHKYSYISPDEMRVNSERAEEKTSLKRGDWVYLARNKELFSKSDMAHSRKSLVLLSTEK